MVNIINKNFKSLLALGVCVSLLSACNDNRYDEIESDNSNAEFTKDKLNTIKQINVDMNNKKEYDDLLKSLPIKQKNMINEEMYSSKVKYYHMKNLNKKISIEYNYIFIVDNTDKFNKLYKNAILELIDVSYTDKNNKVLVYFPNNKKGTVNFSSSKSNVTVKYKEETKDLKFLNDLKYDYVPTFFGIDNKKVYLTLTGYYDYNMLQDKIINFKSINGVED